MGRAYTSSPIGQFAGKTKPDLDIWVVEKTGERLERAKEPRVRRLTVQAASGIRLLSANGTIYFGSDREGGKGRTDIYRSRLMDGKYHASRKSG